MAEDDFTEALRRQVERQVVYAPGLKGVLGDDKENEEQEVACLILNHLGNSGYALVSEPGGKGTPPDVAAILPGGVQVGIEVTELVDGAMRAKHAHRREAERALGLDPQEAFLAEHRAFLTAREAAATACQEGRDPADAFEETLRARHPTPDHVGHDVFADWNDERLARELERIIRTKDSKLRVADQTGYAEILLAIFTDEAAITAEAMVRAAANVAYRPTNIGRVALVAGYNPATGDWPVIVW
ncbi:hypothetical protein [Falsiroseomonas sp. E2-1-a20]|uniref:hypothetical protein n=1 Tax=Falsiroseomonas sp. E2-1-a20 TaxID=3239300 RepID=UPI003F33653C